MEIFPLFSAGSGSELLGTWQYLVGAERFETSKSCYIMVFCHACFLIIYIIPVSVAEYRWLSSFCLVKFSQVQCYKTVKQNIIDIVFVKSEKLNIGISFIHSLVYGHRVLWGMSQIPLLCLSARFSIWIFGLMERYIKNWYSQTGPSGVCICVGFYVTALSVKIWQEVLLSKSCSGMCHARFISTECRLTWEQISCLSLPSTALRCVRMWEVLVSPSTHLWVCQRGCAGASLVQGALAIPTTLMCCGTLCIFSKVQCDRGLFFYIDFLNIFQ